MTYDPRIAAPDPLTDADRALAASVAPVIRFAVNEPFLPSKVGITVLTRAAAIALGRARHQLRAGRRQVIEYAIWWDWDIQHLYELEHVWLKLDAADPVIGGGGERPWRLFDMLRPDGSLPIEDGRVTLYAEPGKHAFHADARDDPCQAAGARSQLRADDLARPCADQRDVRGGLRRHHRRGSPRRSPAPAGPRLPALLPLRQARSTSPTLEPLSWPELHDYIARARAGGARRGAGDASRCSRQ